ncbi:hypothetical protein [Roseburia sp. 499]|uniref:hypothetical protein n=1 Tax=Roseburia sp. 499 TaxID=1261634 RepID=UPI002ED43A93|nr:hypothetical protein BIV20_12730 [Roseburia sp. 499]
MGNFSPTTKARAWIAVVHIGNMESIGLSLEEYRNPEYLAQVLSALWNESGKGRSCAVAVCESADGCYHAHMALYGNSTTLKNVSDILYQSHIEPQLGGKKELTSYILKQGKHAEKGEKILYVKDIEAIQDVRGKRSDLEVIEEMLIKGFTPQQILESNFMFYKYETKILHAYIDQKLKDAPVKRDIYCEYHVGESGTGKTYFYEQLCKEHGVDNIYVITDYDNNASAGLDDYMKVGAPPILFMDEFKGFGISYGKLLVMLNGYTRMQTHSRYSNTYNLWETVYITSVYPPEVIYQIMVPESLRDIDSYTQLIRRISKIVYHYKENDEYKTYTIDSKDYIDYEDLKTRAHKDSTQDNFYKLSETEQLVLPFKQEKN